MRKSSDTAAIFPEGNAFLPAVRPLLRWYRENARDLPWRNHVTAYHTWVSEIMLQQTRVEAVKGYYKRFLEAFPTVRDLSEAPQDRLLKLWEGLGYYSRARNLQKAARMVVDEYGGELPADYSLLLKLPGIGEYTAGAIGSIAYGLGVPAVDGNVLRVAARLMAIYEDMAKPAVKRRVTALLQEAMPHEAPGDFNQSLMELGATVCLPNGAPLCSSCPLAGQCEAYRQGAADELPVRPVKKPRRVEERTVLVIISGGRVALTKRPDTGLLAGLWEFPCLPGFAGEGEAAAYLREAGFDSGELTPLAKASHIFTHVRWEMQGYRLFAAKAANSLEVSAPADTSDNELQVGGRPASSRNGAGFAWADLEGLKTQYSIPSAYRAYLAAAKQALEG